MQIREDNWLSGVLGMPCFKAEVGDVLPISEVRTALAHTTQVSRCMVFAKVATSQTGVVEALVKAGFLPVDVSTTFLHAGSAVDPTSLAGVTTAQACDADEVADLAGRSFTFSRFHADTRIGKARADAVKRVWAGNACRGRAAVTYVVKSAGRIAGFLAVLARSTASGRDAIIDLIGVDPAHQGKGYGRAMTARFVSDWHGKADRLLVGTQAANIPAVRLYEALGFRMHESAFVLHAHLDNGEVVA